MKIQCALSQSQIEKLYSNVYGHMLNKGEDFNPEEYMKELFNKIAKNSDVETAAKFMQQVPSMIGTASFRPALEDFEIKTDSLKPLIKKFKKAEDGLENTIKYFRPQLDPDVEKELIEKKALKAFHITERTSDEIMKDPFDYQPYSALSTTFQELFPKNPDSNILEEQLDRGRWTIYRTLDAIRNDANNNTPLRELVYQGKVLKLKPVNVSAIDKNLLDYSTRRLVTILEVLKAKGKSEAGVTTPDKMFLMVLSDNEGNFLQFDKEGNIVEQGGELVYQFLREVRKEGNKYRVTNIYGITDQILDPFFIAQKAGISVEEAEKRQQQEFKELYEFREKLIAGEIPLVDIVGVSKGISEIKPDSLSLANISAVLDDNDHAIRTLDVVKSERAGYEKGEAVITIKGVEYKVDRPNLTDELINKIALALTTKNLTNKQKYNFVSQFLGDKVSPSTRKHELIYLEKTGSLIFSYSPTTYQEGYSQFINVDLNSPEAYTQITEALKNASGEKGRYYSAKMSYNKEALEKGFLDYNTETNQIFDDYSDYITLIKNLPNTKIFADVSVDSRSFNSYIRFAIPNAFTEQLNKAKESKETIDKDDFFESLDNVELTPGEELFNTLTKEAWSSDPTGWKTKVINETGKNHTDNYYLSTYLTNQLKTNSQRFSKEVFEEVISIFKTFRKPSSSELEIIEKEFNKAFAPKPSQAQSLEDIENEINTKYEELSSGLSKQKKNQMIVKNHENIQIILKNMKMILAFK